MHRHNGTLIQDMLRKDAKLYPNRDKPEPNRSRAKTPQYDLPDLRGKQRRKEGKTYHSAYNGYMTNLSQT